MSAAPDPIDTVPRINWRVAITAASAAALLFATQNVAVLGLRQSFLNKLAGQAVSWAIWLLLLPLIFEVCRRAREDGVRWRSILFQIAACIAVSIAHDALLAFARWSVGYAGKFGLLSTVRAHVTLNFPSNVLRYGFIASIYHVIAYQLEMRARDIAQARLAQSLAEARLQNLEARLQPHFLFNALNTIAALVRKNPSAAALMVGQLSDLLRAALHAEAGREVTLASELRLLDQYMAIQRTRFSDRLTFTVDASGEALESYVPQMILQPIVENAVRHGIGPRESAGSVAIEAYRDGARLRLVVRDDGVGYGQAPMSLRGNGVGLRATRARLEQLYGRESAFDIRCGAAGGTVVTIDLPFHTGAREQPRGAA